MYRLLTTALAIMCLASPVLAASLPLRPGGYVEAGTSCANGSDANSLDYLGGTIEVAGVTTTNQKVISHSGNTYHLLAKAVDNQAGTSTLEVETVIIHSPTALTLATRYGTANYRWCHAGSAL